MKNISLKGYRINISSAKKHCENRDWNFSWIFFWSRMTSNQRKQPIYKILEVKPRVTNVPFSGINDIDFMFFNYFKPRKSKYQILIKYFAFSFALWNLGLEKFELVFAFFQLFFSLFQTLMKVFQLNWKIENFPNRNLLGNFSFEFDLLV